jgi:hypothetical protein
VLHILLRVVEAHLRKRSPGASPQARFGAVSFVHRFGASLNRHLHYHCCILDGVFEPLEAGGVQFRQASALAPEKVAVIEEQVRRRVLRWFSRHGLLDPDDARDMLAWAKGGFSLDASVCIAEHDRAGLDQLLKGQGDKVKYFDLSGGRLTSLSRREQNHARGLLLAGFCRSAEPQIGHGRSV